MHVYICCQRAHTSDLSGINLPADGSGCSPLPGKGTRGTDKQRFYGLGECLWKYEYFARV